MMEILNSKYMTEAGSIQLIDNPPERKDTDARWDLPIVFELFLSINI